METAFATTEEKSKTLPCDDLVRNPFVASTHGITILSPPNKIWPWLVQMGQGRAGFYSYTFFENLLGCQMRNADEICPQLQSIQIGQPIPIHPKFNPLFVKEFEQNQQLILWQQRPFLWTWAFYLGMMDSDSTRLLVRSRMAYPGPWAAVPVYAMMKFGHYIMERKLLIEVKKRAEK
ncbi:MAG: SRPBCC family protein [Planctomycetota bacterium]